VTVPQIGPESTCTCLYPSLGPEGTHCLFCGYLWPRHQMTGRRRGQRGTKLPAGALPRLWIKDWDGQSTEWWEP
jgi:hypothetical protein